ncbi:MAG: cytochrome C biogenesis protein [Chitinophagales bacterium]|nr:cytochrome C biogenesis protein [Chitinophagales bacterium]MDW8393436.1 cytochrome C biogenesis protein [Chitinophagales bacterium]
MNKQLWALAHKEFLTEWRSRYSQMGVVLYLAASVFILYLGLQQADARLWVALYWVVLFFTSVTAIAKSFLQESRMRLLYYQSVASPLAVFLAKALFHFVQLLALAALCWLLFSLFFDNPIMHPALFVLIVVSGSLTFVLAFTLMSAIAAKAAQALLMAVLCLPVVLPSLMLLLRLSHQAAMEGPLDFPWTDLAMLWALDVILLLLALILFPYLWRD